MHKLIVFISFIFLTIFFGSNATSISAKDSVCSDRVSYFYAQNRCNTSQPHTFSGFEYRCEGEDTLHSFGLNYCSHYNRLYDEALKACRLRCASPQPSINVTPSPIASVSLPTCQSQELVHFGYREICPIGNIPETSYHYLDYTCGSETSPRTVGGGNLCQAESVLWTLAESDCRKNTCELTNVNLATQSSISVNICKLKCQLTNNTSESKSVCQSKCTQIK